MHMHKEHNGAAPVQKSCIMCLFTSHLSHVLNNHIDRTHLGISKPLNVIIVIFLQRAKVCISIMNTLNTKKEATLTIELCECRTSNA